MRKRIVRKSDVTMLIIVDGKDEKWYLEKVKECHPNATLRRANIKPELAQKKKIDDLFSYARDRYNEEYRNIVLVLDMDNILKENSEFERFKVYYQHYLMAQCDGLTSRQKSAYGWMKELTLIINVPCLEFWYLLHYGKTTKFFADFTAMESSLKQKKNLSDYEKSEQYYKKSPDIYTRLGGLNGLNIARNNAEPFNLADAHTKGVSEMNKLFELIERLDAKAQS